MAAVRSARRNDFFNSSGDTPQDLPSGTFIAQKVSATSYLASSKRPSDEKIEVPSVSMQTNKREIGFVNLLNQIYTRSAKRGFSVNLMVTGRSGLGKSTFINSLLISDFYNTELPSASSRYRSGKPVKPVEAHTVRINEQKINLHLTIIDTPGFGDEIDNSHGYVPLVDEIESRFQDYLKKELKVSRHTSTNGSAEFSAVHLDEDPRVHACLYFLPPDTKGISLFDLISMQHLHKRVNLIPVIAKSDTLTADECKLVKKTILRQLAENNITVYSFDGKNVSGEKQDPELVKYRHKFPFSIVSSNTMVLKPDGSKVRGRQYPWGIVETDSLEHNDFTALRSLLITSDLYELIDRTHFGHYAIYRQEQLSTINMKTAVNGDANESEIDKNAISSGPLYQLEIERKQQQAKNAHLEKEMEAVFDQKVRERAQKLQEKEVQFEQASAAFCVKIDEEMRQLERDERQFQLERAEWESQNKETLLLVSSTLDAKERSKTKRLGIF